MDALRRILRCSSSDEPEWLRLRSVLWPDAGQEKHTREMTALCAAPERHAIFLAWAAPQQAEGFVEISLRTDPVNGAQYTPTAFLEGVYVDPQARRQGLASALLHEAMRWARKKGCLEIASDAALENTVSHALHHALGFTETERVIFFRRPLNER